MRFFTSKQHSTSLRLLLWNETAAKKKRPETCYSLFRSSSCSVLLCRSSLARSDAFCLFLQQSNVRGVDQASLSSILAHLPSQPPPCMLRPQASPDNHHASRPGEGQYPLHAFSSVCVASQFWPRGGVLHRGEILNDADFLKTDKEGYLVEARNFQALR